MKKITYKANILSQKVLEEIHVCELDERQATAISGGGKIIWGMLATLSAISFLSFLACCASANCCKTASEHAEEAIGGDTASHAGSKIFGLFEKASLPGIVFSGLVFYGSFKKYNELSKKQTIIQPVIIQPYPKA